MQPHEKSVNCSQIAYLRFQAQPKTLSSNKHEQFTPDDVNFRYLTPEEIIWLNFESVRIRAKAQLFFNQ